MPSPTATVTFQDDSGFFDGYRADMRDALQAAWDQWAQYIQSDANIEFDLTPGDTSKLAVASGGWTAVAPALEQAPDGRDIYRGTITEELITGYDTTGAGADGEISINRAPDQFFYPSDDTGDSFNPTQLSAEATLAHEIGHALGFIYQGGGSDTTVFPYDLHVEDPGAFVPQFDGQNATRINGGEPVDLASGDPSHVGEPGDLMTPGGAGREVSLIDAAMLKDLGVPVDLNGFGGEPLEVSPALDVLIDDGVYESNNPDVEAAGIDPDLHYLTSGEDEGRKPNEHFDPAYYEAHNPDVEAAGMSPLRHFAQYGWQEGRNPSASFDVDAYLDANPDVDGTGMNPLVHYLEYGRFEGRQAIPVDGSAEQTLAGLAPDDAEAALIV